MRPDVVFVHPSDRYEQYQELGRELTAIEPPVWAGLLAEYTRCKGYGVEVIDMDAHELSAAHVAEQVAWLDPVLVCVVAYGHHPSASTQNMPAVRKVCQAVKDHHPRTPILLAGGHVAALPERTMREEPCDFVSDGEGMSTIVGLVEALRSLQRVYSANADVVLSKVPDLWYRSQRGIYRSPVWAPLLQDLDSEMPGLAWDLLPMDKYRCHNWQAWGYDGRTPYASLYTTLGCQFKCSFCLSAGTMVTTVEGNDQRIEDLRRGDRLVAWDEHTRGFVETTIVSTSCRLVAPLRRIKTASGREICITRDHPVLTMVGWVEAGSLRREDFVWVMEKDGETPLLNYEAIAAIEEVSAARPVYNFQCHPYDNYFADRILVHNCCIQAPFRQGEHALGYKETRNSYRYWSPDAVIAQIDTLVTKYGVRHLKFADEMFVLTPRHVEGICDKIIECGYDLNIWAYARVDTAKDRMLEKMAKAGFRWVAYGVEAAAERVRDDVQKGFDQDDIADTIARTQKVGIHVLGNYIFGLPEDDLSTMQQTLDLATELNSEHVNMYITMSYPGSALYEQAVRDGRPLPPSWEGYSQHGYETWPSPTKYVDGPTVLRFRDQAFTTYFTNPSYLAMIERTFGTAAVDHIRRMVAIPLKRRYLIDETHSSG